MPYSDRFSDPLPTVPVDAPPKFTSLAKLETVLKCRRLPEETRRTLVADWLRTNKPTAALVWDIKHRGWDDLLPDVSYPSGQLSDRSVQRTFFVDASRSSVDEVERVVDADLDEDLVWIDAVEQADEMIAVDFWTYGGLSVDEVEAALREKLRQAGFRTVGYDERFGDPGQSAASPQ